MQHFKSYNTYFAGLVILSNFHQHKRVMTRVFSLPPFYLNPQHLKNLMLESDLAFHFFLSVMLGGGGEKKKKKKEEVGGWGR